MLTKLDKLYEQMVNNPKDVNFDDLDKLLKRYGFQRRQPRGGSSHYSYSHPDLQDVLTIPKARPIKAIYVKAALDAIRKIEADRSDDE